MCKAASGLLAALHCGHHEYNELSNFVHPSEECDMAIGTVKWFNATKGFGFIQPEGGGTDVFVHISAVERAGMQGLKDGQRLSYDEELDRKKGKTSASNLKPL